MDNPTMPNAAYSAALASIPAQAMRAFDALVEESRRSDAALEARAGREEGASSSVAAGLLRHMAAHGSSIAALLGLERALEDISERTAVESGRSVQLAHLSGWGIERSLLYLRVVAGFAMAGAEEPARRLRAESESRMRLARGEPVPGPFTPLESVVADIRTTLEALGRDIAARVDRRDQAGS